MRSTCSPSFRKMPLRRMVGLDGDDVVIDQKALFDGGFVAVFEHLVLKERGGVAGGRGGEADFDGVEVVERAARRAGKDGAGCWHLAATAAWRQRLGSRA